MKTKIEIRREIREKKKGLSARSLQQQSEYLMRLLEEHERFQKAHAVLLYSALPDEPQTQVFLDRWAKEKCILLPVVVGDHLVLSIYRGREDLKEGAFHILEPQGPVFTDYALIDLVVVPGVAFDGFCHRLGRGKGYYDRLLSLPEFRKVYKLGICFDFQKIDEVPVAPFDISMDEVL